MTVSSFYSLASGGSTVDALAADEGRVSTKVAVLEGAASSGVSGICPGAILSSTGIGDFAIIKK